MIILYGSQNGNAKHVAQLIQNTLLYGYNDETIYNIPSDNKIKSYTIDMNSFDFTKIYEIKTIIFVCSTHGNGTEPFNMTKFWKTICNKNLPENFLSHLNFAVFGLGDSSYNSFNYCAKKLYNCLIKRGGAHPLIRRGNGDSQDKEGFLSDLKIWMKDLYPLISHLPLKDATQFAINKNKFLDATLVCSKLLTPKDYNLPILELQFDVNIPNYSVGDCLAIYPENYNYLEFVKFNNIECDEFIKYIKNQCDFNSIPQQHFFLQLSLSVSFTTEEYQMKCREMYYNYDLYYEYVLLTKRTIFEIIIDFKVKPSKNFILMNIPIINPRFFTLTKRKECFCITTSLVSYKTRLTEPRKGLCSEYFRLLPVGSTIKVSHISNKISFNTKNLCFICTGTGITLPRAYINFLNENVYNKIIILYGFRYRDRDFLYEDELKKDNVNLYCAVSRDDKKYVQDVFHDINEIKNIDEWSIIVSGNSRLNNIVDKLFKEVYKKKIHFQTETW
ncbi:NADPH-dependent diflavin oxidoreductase 1 (NDOR1) [Vairimorpha necatrix]|uniref:NADPH-dependent diflavin oxidoreductase 1 (NDOR1) n=1 Tax=Vairimorpha necatrix TaxID=6039 RepID=A0AAX4JD78_9MICR